MINRIVKMTFRPECVSDFEKIFKANKHRIAGYRGCTGVELLRDISNPAVYFTYSKWENETCLNDYRNSALFNEVWTEVKKWFAAKPEAWSVETITE